MSTAKNTACACVKSSTISGCAVPRLYDNGILSTIGGMCAFMAVMGIGRFIYTVLLPGMMQTYGFGEDVAGVMAAWNYAGYLAGVLAMRTEKPGIRRYALMIVFLFLSLVTTAGMGMVHTTTAMHALRFFGGIASGASFVLCSSIVLDNLFAINRPVLGGLLYGAVGAGLALGGAIAGPLEAVGGSETAWLGAAAVCIPLAITGCITLRPSVNHAPAPQPSAASTPPVRNAEQRRKYTVLLIAYFLEGFGYIIGTTFLVTLVQTSTNSPELARASWIVTGCAALVTAPLWRLAARNGYAHMLILALVLQGLGVLLPVMSHSAAAACTGGFFLGGTFAGITVLSLQYGVFLSGKPSAHTVAVLTALYGIGQIIGPFVAGMTAADMGLSFAFVLSAMSLFIAAGLLFAGHSRKSG